MESAGRGTARTCTLERARETPSDGRTTRERSCVSRFRFRRAFRALVRLRRAAGAS